jgi:(2Fe-2S) ferredoxin
MKKRKAYVLVCTSQKPKQWNAGCCGDRGGDNLLKELKDYIEENQLTDEIIIKKSSCVNNCANGISVRMLNDGIVYSKVKKADIEEIIKGHCINGQPVERLVEEYDPIDDS